MTKPRLQLASTADIAYHFGVAPGTVRRWAHEDGWRPYGTRRERLWNLIQAQASYERRYDRNTPNVSVGGTCI